MSHLVVWSVGTLTNTFDIVHETSQHLTILGQPNSRILSLQRAARVEEAHRIRKSQCRRTDGRIVGIRKVDSMNEVETPAIEEHVHRKPRAIDTFDSGVVLKPDPSGVTLA